MPGWNIHLEAGNRLADRLKFSGAKRQEFLFGCLLPDINNGFINRVKIKKQHEETHYAYDQKSSLNFYAENRQKILDKDPLYLGYLLHLYTDGYFNYDFYRTIKRHKLGEGRSHEEKRTIKHHDFWLYDTNFHHQLGIHKSELKHLAARANEISVTEISPEDIEDVERILADDELNQAIKGQHYQFYSKKRLDDLLDDMIESFSNDYLSGESSNA